MAKKKFKNFHETVEIIKSYCNIKHPILVKRCIVPKDREGDCELRKKKFIIRIDRNIPEYFAIDVLIHEAAHALSWNKDKDEHGLNWGKAYSKVYRIFLKHYHKYNSINS